MTNGTQKLLRETDGYVGKYGIMGQSYGSCNREHTGKAFTKIRWIREGSLKETGTSWLITNRPKNEEGGWENGHLKKIIELHVQRCNGKYVVKYVVNHMVKG